MTPFDAAKPSDPAMVLVPAGKKYAKDITFYVSSVNVDGAVTDARNYLTIVAKTAAKDILTLDDTLIRQYSYGFDTLQSLQGTLNA